MLHAVYQKTLAAHLARWHKRRARGLPEEWLQAALLLWRLDLDPLRPMLTQLYARTPRGRPPYDPLAMLRALLLMTA